MTRLERRRRSQWRCVLFIVAAHIIGFAIFTLLFVKPWVKAEAVERVAYDPPAKPIAEVKAEIAMRSDHPNRFYYRQEIPLGRYQQETIYNAAVEWGIPYELALAVCFRETNYRNMETEVDGKHYYGMMAVQLESAGYYMDLCDVEYLNSEQDRIRVGCCILSEHIKNEGSIRAALCRYSNDYEGWYADSVLKKMGELME
jgi:hypothetical protein